MYNQRQLSLLLILASLGVALILYRLAAAPTRRSKPIPPVIQLPNPNNDGPQTPHGQRVWTNRIVAVGDLHGDLANTQAVLRMAGIIDGRANWIGGNDTLVQTGDMVDRGTDTIGLYRLMQSLRSQATGQGGQVVSVLGNHEYMNAIGDWRYVTEDDIKTFGGSKARQDILSTEGWIGQEWLANYTATARVPLSPYDSPNHYLAFSHGSLHPELDILTPFPSRPNAIGHSLLLKALTKPMPLPYPPNPYPGLPRDSNPEENTFYGTDGPVWHRGLAIEEDEEKVCAWADTLKKRLGVRRIIGGHTPNFERIVTRCNSDVVIIDTGISRAYGGVLSALETIYSLYEVPTLKELDILEAQDVFQIDKVKKTVKEFIEVETVTALTPAGRTLLRRTEGAVKFDTSRRSMVNP